MKTLTVKFTFLPLLLLLMWWFERSESLITDIAEFFFPFGRDEGDSGVPYGSICSGPIAIPYSIFDYSTLYVSYACEASDKPADLYDPPTFNNSFCRRGRGAKPLPQTMMGHGRIAPPPPPGSANVYEQLFVCII